MTEMLNKEFSRKSFVKGGGALVVGFSVAGAALAGARPRRRPTSPYASNGPFDQQRDRLVARRSTPTTRSTLKSGKVELGQGTLDRPADDRGRGARHGASAR